MAVIYSQNLPSVSSICQTRACKACGLHIHQKPIFDDRRPSSVFWVGLSAVRFNDGQKKLPLSPLTPSGALIESIEKPFSKKIKFYKTNIVKCVPLTNDRIRYPLLHEMEKCFPNFEWELEQLQPQTIFLLGKQVANFVCKKLTSKLAPGFTGYDFPALQWNGIEIIPIHHPSYILVYQRKKIEEYRLSIQELFPRTAGKIAC